MEKKTDALVLKSVNYRENDKMITLLTSDLGKIGASLKGVRKAGAKLRFAGQPFCFAEYVLTQKDDRHTVISASLYDSFFTLGEDLTDYYAACAVVEICDKLSYENMDTRELLLSAVRALKALSCGGRARALTEFMLKALSFAGFSVRADRCPGCGKELAGRMRFDFSEGAFLCDECGKGSPASEITYQTVRALLRGEEPPEGDGMIRALRLLRKDLICHAESEFPALSEAISLYEEE